MGTGPGRHAPPEPTAILPDGRTENLRIEHPTGEITVISETGSDGSVVRAAF